MRMLLMKMETRGRGDGGSDDGGESEGKACGEKKRENEGAIAVLLSKMGPNNSYARASQQSPRSDTHLTANALSQ